MENLSKGKENRFFPRIDFSSQVRFQARGKTYFESGLTKDICYGGLRFVNDVFLAPSTPVMLEINVLNRVLRPIAKVAWSTPIAHSNRNQTGVEFIEFDSFEKNYLKEFINLQLS